MQMAKRLAIAVIHGMGSQQPEFADEMIDALNGRVGDLNKDPDEIAWRSIFWANILAPRQEEYLRDANQNNDLDYIGLRRLVVSAVGDASAYRHVDSPENTPYDLIHGRVRDAINALDDALDVDDAPLIVMAHSLGGHIMSNYI